MNSRIYPKEVFENEVNKYLGKIYCPHCYSFVIDSVLSYAKYNIKSKVRNMKYCGSCEKHTNNNNLLTKVEIRTKKIDEVLKK